MKSTKLGAGSIVPQIGIDIPTMIEGIVRRFRPSVVGPR
jgi:hypothetical protein